MSAELEYGIVGDFMVGRHDGFVRLIDELGLKPDYFADNTARRAYERILELKSNDPQLIQAELVSLLGVEAVEKAVSCASLPVEGDVVTAYARRIEKVVKDGRIREMQSKIAEVHKLAANTKMSAEVFAAETIRVLERYAEPASGSSVPRPVKLSQLGPKMPEAENPLALFENGWLRKGQAAFLVSSSGAGKSVIATQFCYAWARGEEMFGIRPFRPLRIAVFQTEDDDDELRFFRDAMAYGYTHHCGWTDADVKAAVDNIDFFPVLDRMGDDFIRYFREIQAAYNYDLVIINPFQGVTDFDISDNTAVRQFTRQRLDPIIKDAAKPCGLFIIHHTNKMQGDTSRRPTGGKDTFAQYVGAGASEINNWMRAGFVILPYSKDGLHCYQLVAAKRGGRLAKWKLREGMVNPTKFIRHSDDEVNYPFWFECTPADADKTAEERRQQEEQAKSQALEEDAALLAKTIIEPTPAMNLRTTATSRWGRTHGREVYAYLVENSEKFGIISHKGTNNNAKVYGTPQMFMV